MNPENNLVEKEFVEAMRRQALGRANTIIIVTAIFFATAPFIVAGYYIVGIYRFDQQQKAEAARQAQEA